MDYVGEFGTELNSWVPFVYYLKATGQLKHPVIIYPGMRPYYFFLNDNEVVLKSEPRYWIPPDARLFLPQHLRDDIQLYSKLNHNIAGFKPPPFKDFYSKMKVESSKPIAVIQNKFNLEWGHPPKHFFTPDMLFKMIDILKERYTIVYIRTNDIRRGDYSTDVNEEQSLELNEKQALRERYTDGSVLLFEDILTKVNYDFNTFKCIMLANTSLFISVVGGHVDFANYFPGTHIIYKVWLPDVFVKDFYQNQHNMLLPHNKDDLYVVGTYEEVLRLCERMKGSDKI
jgi:hypothetical protein